MRQALEALKGWKDEAPASWTPSDDAAVAALEAALMEPVVVQEQEPHWLTKLLMADYLDMIAEAIENHSSETLRHKAHWMRTRGEV
jgi:hypothetical protein